MVLSSVIDQVNRCISSALCDPVSQLHTVCLGLETVIKFPELCYISNNMRSCPCIHHQAFALRPRWISLLSSLTRNAYSLLLVSSETLCASSRHCFRLQVVSLCVVLLHSLQHCLRWHALALCSLRQHLKHTMSALPAPQSFEPVETGFSPCCTRAFMTLSSDAVARIFSVSSWLHSLVLNSAKVIVTSLCVTMTLRLCVYNVLSQNLIA